MDQVVGSSSCLNGTAVEYMEACERQVLCVKDLAGERAGQKFGVCKLSFLDADLKARIHEGSGHIIR